MARSSSSSRGATALRLLGAVAVLGVGAVHVYEYTHDGYSNIPTIGPLFLLNAISSGLVGLGLLALARPFLVTASLALSGVGIAVGALVALFVSENVSLFGFMETGYRPIVVIAIAVEAVTVLTLGGYLASRRAELTALRR